jgi:hypothetical protein
MNFLGLNTAFFIIPKTCRFGFFHVTMKRMTTESSWWTQGTLHEGHLEDWRVAEQNNRLATALDMLMALKEETSTQIAYETGEELMRYVIETVGCLDAMASQVQDPEGITVAQAFLTGAKALDYFAE